MKRMFLNILVLALISASFVSAMAGIAAALIYLEYLYCWGIGFVILCAIVLFMILCIVVEAHHLSRGDKVDLL